MFYARFADREDIERNFMVTLDPSVEILFASYGGGVYEGDAFVLFEQDGKLFQVTGGHCSCYGLEGQWDPEETTLEYLRRINAVTDYHFLRDHDATAADFAKVLDELGGSS